jgi:hypothetical protein
MLRTPLIRRDPHPNTSNRMPGRDWPNAGEITASGGPFVLIGGRG